MPLRLFFLALGLALSPLSVRLPAATPPPVREIPADPWVSIYFESIDRDTAAVGLKPLRTATLPADAIEVRMWAGFGLNGEHAWIIERKKGVWRGLTLGAARPNSKSTLTPVSPQVPWEETWTALLAKRLLTLPDFASLPLSSDRVNDGVSLVVEVFAEGRYRTFMYPNPQAFDHPECREVEALYAAAGRAFVAGAQIPPAPRTFLDPLEIKRLAYHVSLLTFPVAREDFVKGLPFDLPARSLRTDGTTEQDGVRWTEWPLTARSDPHGHYVLRGYLNKKSPADPTGESTVRHAEILYYDHAMGLPLVLQPWRYPSVRTPPYPAN